MAKNVLRIAFGMEEKKKLLTAFNLENDQIKNYIKLPTLAGIIIVIITLC